MKSLKFYGAIGGAVALIGCWPLAVGQIAHTAFEDMIASADNSNLSIELVDYQRGYFSSTATSQVVVEAELAKQQLMDLGLPTEFTVLHDISHGLISVSTDSTIEQLENDALSIHSKTLLNGATDFAIDYSESIDVVLEDGARLEIPSWNVTGDVNTDESLQYAIKTPLIRMYDDLGAELAINGVEVTAQGNFNSQMWLGTQNFSVDSVVFVESESGFDAEVQNINYHLQTSQDSDTQTYSTSYKLTLSKLRNIDIEATNVVVSMSADGFDALSVDKLASLTSGAELSDEELSALFDTLIAMLAKGVSLEQEQFSFEYGNGSFNSVWDLHWPEQPASKDVFEMLMAVEGNFSAYITKPLVEAFPMVEQVVDELMVMEIMTDDGQGYQLRAKISDSNVEFENGQKIPILMLAMAALSNSNQ
jgi:uncharacterized protein YdgA (DUF945 family)